MMAGWRWACSGLTFGAWQASTADGGGSTSPWQFEIQTPTLQMFGSWVAITLIFYTF